jgi:transcriptional regulator with PAS, ATPase and Fis domain
MAAVWLLLGKTRFPATFYETFGGKSWVTDVPFDLIDVIPEVLRNPDAHLQHLAALAPSEIEGFEDIAGESRAIRDAVGRAKRAAIRSVSVLLMGESGTGKEMFAQAIHKASTRRNKPIKSVNCAALSKSLLESELFGHEKGAFTGAIARRIGKFEEANGGTLLLDEISEMDVSLQAKLLRAIQERVIDRLGGRKPVPVDIRIIATSNRNLTEEVAKGNFREDLLYRLNVVNLKIPCLRERPRDIEALAVHFIKKYADSNGLPVRPLSAGARQQLTSNPWPGNVRELENTMHRAVLLTTSDEIGVEAIRSPDGNRLEEMISTGNHGPAAQAAVAAEAISRTLVGRTVAQVEQDLILQTLDHSLGNRTHAANILGISIRTLRNKLRLYGDDGIPVPNPGAQRPLAV